MRRGGEWSGRGRLGSVCRASQQVLLLGPHTDTPQTADSIQADEERQAARQALLAKETRLLQTIDRLKVAATPSVRAERAVRQLATAAAPRDWQLGEGGAVEVTTPATLRAGELAATHAALVADDGRSLDARLAALLAAKFYAKEVDCRLVGGWRVVGDGVGGARRESSSCSNSRLADILHIYPLPGGCSLTREIVSLVDREADLLNRCGPGVVGGWVVNGCLLQGAWRQQCLLSSY